MSRIFRVAVALMSAGVSLFSSQGFAQSLDQLTEIMRLPVIRVATLDDSDKPNPNTPYKGTPEEREQLRQADMAIWREQSYQANAAIVRRLRELGYKGKIELVYRNTPSDRKALAVAVPPFSVDGPAVQEVPSQGLTFVDWESASLGDREAEPTVDLAIVGAFPGRIAPKKAGARVTIVVQPDTTSTLWNARLDPYVQTYEPIPGWGSEKARAGNQQLVYALPNPEDWESTIRTQMQHHPVLAKKIAGLRNVMMFRGRSDIAAFSLLDSSHRVVHENPTIRLVRYAQGLLKASTESPEKFKKGIVILDLDDQSTFPKNQAPYSTADDRILMNPRLKDRVSVVDVHDLRKLERDLRNLKAGQILVVRVGQVSTPVEQLLSQMSSVPPVVSKASVVGHMQLAERPYLPGYVGDIGWGSLGFALPKGEGIAIESPEFRPALLAHLALNENGLGFVHDRHKDSPLGDKTAAEAISEFVKVAMSPESMISNIFTGLRPGDSEYRSRDKVVSSLLIAIKALKVMNREGLARLAVAERARNQSRQALAEGTGSPAAPMTCSDAFGR